METTTTVTNSHLDNDVEMEIETCETQDSSRVKSLEAEISRLKSDNSSIKLEYEALMSNTNSIKRQHETQISQLAGEIDRVNAEYKTERERADETLKTLSADLERLKSQLEESTCVKSKLVDEKNQLVGKIEALNARLNEIQAEKQRLTTQIDGLNTKLEEIEAERLVKLNNLKNQI